MRRRSLDGLSVCLIGALACSDEEDVSRVGPEVPNVAQSPNEPAPADDDDEPALAPEEPSESAGGGAGTPGSGGAPQMSTDGEGAAGGRSGASNGAGQSGGEAGQSGGGPGGTMAGGAGGTTGGAGGQPPVAAGSGGTGVPPNGSDAGTAGGGGLPDIAIDAAYLRSTIQQDFVDASADMCLFNEGCVTGSGMRRVIRFGTRSGNVGTADIVAGRPEDGNPLWEFDACHEHYHFEGYAHYDLVEASTETVLPVGVKNGFCIRDQGFWSSENATSDCARYDCDIQGLGVGCADVYGPELDCQWVDITGVPPGNYDIVVTLNSEQLIEELDRSNNVASVRVEITAESVRVLP